ncbi:hypothetical protein LTR08_002011 [Meristemomyces frigidus]|nr:hypothetical protein LTR08_002011 [Meristemomyces frigidus]
MAHQTPTAIGVAGSKLAPDNEPSFTVVRRSMKRDPSGKGIGGLGRDGVWRNFDSNRQVVDARGLSPAQIKQWLDRTPFEQAVEDAMRGVDGRTVPEEEMFHPDPSLLPVERPAEEKAESRRVIEQQKREYKERESAGILDDKSLCGRLVSDYDLNFTCDD